MSETFEALLEEAEHTPFSGWDFSWLRGRWRSTAPSWDYVRLAREHLHRVASAVDLGTGGGEVLAQMQPFPVRMVATEAYPPNVAVARSRLEPLGVEVVQVRPAPANVHMDPGDGPGSLPFNDAEFDLVLNRHESYFADEVHRILRPGGTFLTQQVGESHMRALNQHLGAPDDQFSDWNAAFAAEQIRQAGFRVVDVREEHPESWFGDIGAVAYYLRAVPWEIKDFTIERYRDRLHALHERIERDGGLVVREHLFLVEAVRD